MSTSKRPRTNRTAGTQRSPSPGDLPASKRRKPSHVPEKSNGLDFLVDEDKRAGKTVKAKLTNGVSRSNGDHVDDSHAVQAQSEAANGVKGGKPQKQKKVEPIKEVINISSGEEESSELEEEDDDVDAQTNANVQLQPQNADQPLTNGHVSELDEDEVQEQVEAGADDEEMEDVEAPAEESEEPASFGELLQARHPGPIDVRRTLPDPDSQALTIGPDDALTPSGHSLKTALSQALRNNDKDLLESCFSVTNPTSIRVTIQRLKSHDVALLLERIAERIYKSPGRTGPLMVWVQWALVDHGGYLANQSELMQKLRKLSQVVRERASGLLPLLHLKGKLDLLCAQLQHRRELQANSRAVNMEDPDDDRDVLYVEGQEDDWSEDSDEEMEDEPQNKRIRDTSAADGGLPNGISHDVEEEESSADDDDEEDDEGEPNDMLDIEAEETSDDDADEEEDDSAPSDDEEEEESDNESGDSSGDEIAVAQPKLNTLNRKR